jgi:hypothetical protein
MIEIKEKGEVRISPQALKTWHTYPSGVYDFATLAYLKSQGAPIFGVFMLTPDTVRFDWSFDMVYVDLENQGVTLFYQYTWELAK